jgi:hypothetical protein
MKRNLCSLLLLLVLPSISFASLVYNPTTGHWYERVDTETTWNQARAAAESRGGYLAVITSSAENQWIVDNLGGAATLDHWLGGYNDQGTWKWVTGETWSYANWWPGEPKGFSGYILQFDDDEGNPPLPGFWNDYDPNSPEPGYIVEYSTTSVPIPGAVWLMCSGLAGIMGLKKIQRNRHG